MNIFTITRNGLLTHDDYTVPPFEILDKLRDTVVLEDGITFREIIEFLSNYSDLHYVFPELKGLCGWKDSAGPAYNGTDILLFNYNNSLSWKHYSIDSTEFVPLDDGSGMSEMKCTYDYETPSVYENNYFSLNLLSDGTEYSISFTPIIELLEVPVKINKEIIYVSIDDERKTYENEMEFITLFDLITAVSDDVMFHGDEETKQERFDDLKARIEEIDEFIDKDNDDE